MRASEEEYPYLFWGLRGGGGNFGVVTSFEFRRHDLGPEVLAGPIVHSMEAAPELLRFWRDYMDDAPDALQCMPLVFQAPQEETVFALFPLYAGDPSAGEGAMAPLREAGDPLTDDVARVPYAGLLSDLDEMYRAGDRIDYRSAIFDELPGLETSGTRGTSSGCITTSRPPADSSVEPQFAAPETVEVSRPR